MMTLGLVALLTVLPGGQAEGGFRPLSETQIATAFSGKIVTEDSEILVHGARVPFGYFCPNGDYGRPRHRVGPVRGTYSILPGVLRIEIEVGHLVSPKPVRGIDVFGDGSGGVFVKGFVSGAMTPLLFEEIPDGACR